MSSTTGGSGAGAVLTDDEIAWLAMGPFDGHIPGLVRRIRRILEVSQRGLAAVLEDARDGIEGGPLLSVAMWSPELNFVNQALHNGQKLAEVKVGQPSVQVRRPKIH